MRGESADGVEAPDEAQPAGWKNEAALVLSQFISLSAHPDPEAWAKTASQAIRLLNDPDGVPERVTSHSSKR